MCILRRVEEEYQRLNPPVDDNMGYFQEVLGKLTPDEREEWDRQAGEVERLYPVYGSFWAAVEAFEAANPEAL